ncbi:MAG TPA: DNA-processing protein DprA, partial [Thermoleophilia bacterium]|nr:DNA-processing protein DprA [Thermoleophilia bacterium]
MNDDRQDDGRRRCLELVGLVTHHPSTYGPLLRRMGGLDALLEHGELDLEAASASEAVDWRHEAVDRRDEPVDRRTAQGERSDGLVGREGAPTGRPGGSAHRSVSAYVDDGYPPQLAALFDPPPALFVIGERPAHDLARLAELPLVAVVGTRAPSRYGREMAHAIAGGLAWAGVCVVSGLALGIDALAHRAALETTSAPLPTVAVLGCGADVAYPRTNLRLYKEIVGRGLVVSEYPWGTPTRPWRFPARNRIIAALSRAVVIVEGAADSGSLITAEHALDLGRPVFAVPGEAGRRLSAAPHGLLRCGAHLCESAVDVLSLLGLEAGGPAWSEGALARPDDVSTGTDRTPDGPDDALGQSRGGLPRATPAGGTCGRDATGLSSTLLRLLDDGEMDADALAQRVATTAPAVIAALGLLEVEGLVTTAG